MPLKELDYQAEGQGKQKEETIEEGTSSKESRPEGQEYKVDPAGAATAATAATSSTGTEIAIVQTVNPTADGQFCIPFVSPPEFFKLLRVDF